MRPRRPRDRACRPLAREPQHFARLRRLQCRAGARRHGVTRVLGVGLLTAWGEGVAALPDDARRAAAERRVVATATPAIARERVRRATPEGPPAVAPVGPAPAG